MADGVAAQGAGKSLSPYLPPLAVWALAMGTSIGWGSFVITCNTYLLKAGPAGTALGMLVGLGVMIAIARSYHYLMNCYPDAGGAYSYAKKAFGYDYGALVAWFLILTYLAVFWANATSLPLFAHYFLGDTFRFGFMYEIFGYDVYFGEVLLTIAGIVLVGLLCMKSKRLAAGLLVALVAAFTIAIVACFAVALFARETALFTFDPTFLPDSSALSQIIGIACMSPWAFVGFESISNSTEEFSFSQTKSFRIMVVALVVTTALYLCVAMLSITAYPERYDSWFAYLADLGNLSGLECLPAFYAANHYLGFTGVVMLVVALFALIVTSFIGNITALSRLLFALGRDEVVPKRLTKINGQGVPSSAVLVIVVVSLAAPFLGRTAIGWIVDVTTIGAIIIYGFVAFSARRIARSEGKVAEERTGLVGVALMVALGLVLLGPSLFSSGSMAAESYFLFVAWSVLGFIVFRVVLQRDKLNRFGKSIIVWIVLLSLVLLVSLDWMAQASRETTDTIVQDIQTYYSGEGSADDYLLDEDAYMETKAVELRTSNMINTVVVFGLFAFCLVTMVSNYRVMRTREQEKENELSAARIVADTDPLTGVKSRHAYDEMTALLDQQIVQGTVGDFAVAVCDVNGLKVINDTLGHQAGDEYIRFAGVMICDHFKRSPVFRIGGDEFAVILEGSDYEQRHELAHALDARSVEHQNSGLVVVSVGMSDFARGRDLNVQAVFERADAFMYQRKKELKGGDVR